jgi:hypothetical protein
MKTKTKITPMNNSSFFSLNTHDFLKALIVAVGTVVLSGLVTALQHQGWPTTADFQVILKEAATVTAVYLSKNLFSNSTWGKPLKKEENVPAAATAETK